MSLKLFSSQILSLLSLSCDAVASAVASNIREFSHLNMEPLFAIKY